MSTLLIIFGIFIILLMLTVGGLSCYGLWCLLILNKDMNPVLEKILNISGVILVTIATLVISLILTAGLIGFVLSMVGA